MIRHSGACVLFSAMILVLAALVLYRSEPIPLSSASRVEASADALPEPGPKPREEERPPVETPIREGPEPTPPPPEPEPEPASVREPEAPFTLSEPGETLIDVARRVYGSDRVSESLRLVNRDLIDRVDTPIKPGSALRTPPLEHEEASEIHSSIFDAAP